MMPTNLQKAHAARKAQLLVRAQACCEKRFGALTLREAEIFSYAREGGRRIGYTAARRKEHRI